MPKNQDRPSLLPPDNPLDAFKPFEPMLQEMAELDRPSISLTLDDQDGEIAVLACVVRGPAAAQVKEFLDSIEEEV